MLGNRQFDLYVVNFMHFSIIILYAKLQCNNKLSFNRIGADTIAALGIFIDLLN